MSTNKAVLKASIDHYDRMIAWCEKTVLVPSPSFSFCGFAAFAARKMSDSIDELWGSEDCPLCKTYYHLTESCSGCPISNDGHPHCYDTPWTAVSRAKDKSSLIKALKAEKAYLQALFNKEQS